MYAIPTLDEIIPNGNYGPSPIDFWSATSSGSAYKPTMREGEKFFGYVTLQCVDCAFRTYWAYLEVGQTGYYREGRPYEFNVWNFTPHDLDSFVASFLHSKGVTPMRTDSPF
jgi:hypothetical protein